jgi:hypothetical protein
MPAAGDKSLGAPDETTNANGETPMVTAPRAKIGRRIVFLLTAMATFAAAHVGSPDVFLEGSAGPYPMFVTIRPPSVIPGVAEIEIRSASPDIQEIHITPIPMIGAASKYSPTPDVMQRSKQDPQFFTGSVWIMASGSWQVRIQAAGAQGAGQLSVPVPAMATGIKPMQTAIGVGLFLMMIVLALGLISIVGAGAREAQLDAGKAPDRRSKVRARILMAATAAFVVFVLWAANSWWASEADEYAGYVYKPLGMSLELLPPDTEHTARLILTLKVTNWKVFRNLTDLVPDHGHLMHLYVIGEPDAHRVWHLHPEMTSGGIFLQLLPPIPAGRYKLYGDVVHRSGFPETAVAELDVPVNIVGTPLTGDDAAGVRGESPDGAHIVWDRDGSSPLQAKKVSLFKFKLVDKDGAPVPDAELYMGMPGHAAFVKNDGTVFAHIHPSGSVSMAALMVANPSMRDQGMQHMMNQMTMNGLPAEVSFPYAFPTPGDYRIIVNMKHGGVIETGIFDASAQ